MGTYNFLGVSPEGYLADGTVPLGEIVKQGTKDNSVAAVAANTDVPIGIVVGTNNGTSSSAADGQPVAVQRFGKAKVSFGGAVTRGQPVMWSASKTVVLATTGKAVVGYACATQANGDIGEIDLVANPTVGLAP